MRWGRRKMKQNIQLNTHININKGDEWDLYKEPSVSRVHTWIPWYVKQKGNRRDDKSCWWYISIYNCEFLTLCLYKHKHININRQFEKWMCNLFLYIYSFIYRIAWLTCLPVLRYMFIFIRTHDACLFLFFTFWKQQTWQVQ